LSVTTVGIIVDGVIVGGTTAELRERTVAVGMGGLLVLGWQAASKAEATLAPVTFIK
jgi:hypothetical protein